MFKLPIFSTQPTFDLANQLLEYSGQGATVFNLLDDLAQSARKERPAPQFRQILGDPNDFVLSEVRPEPKQEPDSDPEAESEPEPEPLPSGENEDEGEGDRDHPRLSDSVDSTPRARPVLTSRDTDSDARSFASCETHLQTDDTK